jgi:hypothetical protein
VIYLRGEGKPVGTLQPLNARARAFACADDRPAQHKI